jgi:hypothetical protein
MADSAENDKINNEIVAELKKHGVVPKHRPSREEIDLCDINLELKDMRATAEFLAMPLSIMMRRKDKFVRTPRSAMRKRDTCRLYLMMGGSISKKPEKNLGHFSKPRRPSREEKKHDQLVEQRARDHSKPHAKASSDAKFHAAPKPHFDDEPLKLLGGGRTKKSIQKPLVSAATKTMASSSNRSKSMDNKKQRTTLNAFNVPTTTKSKSVTKRGSLQRKQPPHKHTSEEDSLMERLQRLSFGSVKEINAYLLKKKA